MTGGDSVTAMAALSGRAWVFSEPSINTDAIMPRAGFNLPSVQQRELVLATVRPGWSAQVRYGDVLVVGQNFGVGSSRPAVAMLQALGLRAIVAESFGEVFLRNCVSYAMPVLECPGVLQAVQEGDTIEIDPAAGQVHNLTSGSELHGCPFPPMLTEVIERGGVYAILRERGYM